MLPILEQSGVAAPSLYHTVNSLIKRLAVTVHAKTAQMADGEADG